MLNFIPPPSDRKKRKGDRDEILDEEGEKEVSDTHCDMHMIVLSHF